MDLEQIGKALQAADAAGAHDDARRLAQLYKDTQDMQRMANPTGTSGQNFLAGAGKALTDIGRGAGQLVGMGPSPEEVAQQRQQDAPLMKTGAGVAGNITGNIAAGLPTMFIPGVNTYTGAALVGAAMGALQPVESGGERALNVGIGAASGLAGQAIGNTFSRAVQPVQSALNPEEQRLAQVAIREGIPLDAAAATGSKPLKTINAVMENLPFTAGPQAAKAQAVNEAFTAAALRRAGIQGSEALPEVLSGQKTALGKTFEQIAARNTVDLNKGDVVGRLADIAGEAERRLARPTPITNTVDDILRDATDGILEGSKYQGWRSELGRLAKGTDSESHYFGQVKKALDAAFSAQVPKADAEAWNQASRQYANLKTILNASANSTSGQIAPAQLSAALRQSVGKEGVSLGRGDLNDLARVGQKFIKPQIPDSGTAQRALYQSLLTGGGGAGIGAGGAWATGHDPLEGAMYGAGATAAALTAPRLAQMLINNPTLQSYAIEQSMNPTAAQLARALQTTGRTLGTSIPFALEQR
jgi:hypothetical protein